MKSNFRITYRPSDGSREYIAQIIEAESVEEAHRILGPCHSIRGTSIQCHGTTASGDPCQRFTSEMYCCASHDPRPMQQEVSLDLDEQVIELTQFKGDTHYGTQEIDIQVARKAFERGEAIAGYPRTQMVNRLIAFDWDIDAVTASYEREEWERRLDRRSKDFRVTVEAADPVPATDDDLEIRTTHNGWQWWTLGLTLDEAKALKVALDDFIKTGRDQTRNIDGEKIAKEK